MPYQFQEASYRFRELSGQYATIIDVETVGMVFDGVTDNAAVVATLNSQLAAGVALYFPPNPLAALTSQRLILPSGAGILAMPGTSTLKPTSGSTSNPVLLSFATGAVNATVYGLIFDGGGTAFASANTVILGFKGDRLLLDTITVQNTHGIGAAFSTQITNSGAQNCRFSNVGNYWTISQLIADRQQGIGFFSGSGNSDNFVRGCFFENTGLDAISATQQTRFAADNNWFAMDNGILEAVWLDPQPGGFGAAVYVNACSDSIVRNNNALGAPGNAYDIASVGALVKNNRVDGAGAAGIGIFGLGLNTVTGNITANCAQWTPSVFRGGITVYRAVGDIEVEGNICTSSPYGFHNADGATWTRLYIDPDNDFTGNSLAPIFGAHVGEN